MLKQLLGLSLMVMVLAVAAQEKAPAAPRRIALVIGNADYTTLPKLPWVKPGVEQVTEALRGADFEIVPVNNFRYPEFLTVERDIQGKLRAGDVCVVYYAGYAVQSESDNFLLPVNFDGASKAEIEGRAYHFKRLQQILESRGAALKIFVLDAPPQLDVSIPGVTEAGLMAPEINEGSETVFVSAVLPGKWAPLPAGGAASAFSQAVAKTIPEAGLTLAQLFDKVRQDSAPQLPYVISSVVKQQFYFHAPVKVIPTLPPPPPAPEWPRAALPIQNKTDREEYVWIKPGKFQMGCVSGDARCQAAEKPEHEVTISKGFWMGRNEVQVSSYRKYVEVNHLKMPATPPFPGGWKSGDQPIVNVRWEDAARYCGWAGGRLPTEAEWEYAAREGKNGETYPMTSEENSREKANFDGKKGNDIYEYVAPVRKFDANGYGLYDMAGNVWEWVSDYFSSSAYTAAAVTDPKGPASGKDHAMRGGSWGSDPKEHLRISYRMGNGGSAPSIGFRCVLPDTPETRKLLPEPGK